MLFPLLAQSRFDLNNAGFFFWFGVARLQEPRWRIWSYFRKSSHNPNVQRLSCFFSRDCCKLTQRTENATKACFSKALHFLPRPSEHQFQQMCSWTSVAALSLVWLVCLRRCCGYWSIFGLGLLRLECAFQDLYYNPLENWSPKPSMQTWATWQPSDSVSCVVSNKPILTDDETRKITCTEW